MNTTTDRRRRCGRHCERRSDQTCGTSHRPGKFVLPCPRKHRPRGRVRRRECVGSVA
jgi:hypothetical protein